MDDCDIGYKPKFLKINTGSGPYSSDALILSKAPYNTTSNQWSPRSCPYPGNALILGVDPYNQKALTRFGVYLVECLSSGRRTHGAFWKKKHSHLQDLFRFSKCLTMFVPIGYNGIFSQITNCIFFGGKTLSHELCLNRALILVMPTASGHYSTIKYIMKLSEWFASCAPLDTGHLVVWICTTLLVVTVAGEGGRRLEIKELVQE